MKILDALVMSILDKCESYEWTQQGFGFLRTKIANVGRIHLWDSQFRVHGVSDIHAHPWSLQSRIVSGELINQRFAVQDYASDDGLPYVQSLLATGEGGALRGDPKDVWLLPHHAEFYRSGQSYEQMHTEVHRSIPRDGTVTLMERPQGPPLEETYVYWPQGGEWGSAEPRKVDAWQVRSAVDRALAIWSAE